MELYEQGNLYKEEFIDAYGYREMLLTPPNTGTLYTVLHVVVTPTIKSPSSLLYNCNFAPGMNCNINI